MGYRGKLVEREKARELRAQSWTLLAIAKELGVAKSSVSLWVRDVDFVPSPRRYGPRIRPHPFHEAKLAEIAECDAWARERLAVISDDAFFAAGIALYAGEGSKGDGEVRFANSDPEMMKFFAKWLRHYFVIDESRLRGRIYLHQGLDIDAALSHWSEVMGIPPSQFQKPYRAVADEGIRIVKHQFGCGYLGYCCSKTHRQIMGLCRALITSRQIPG